METSFQRIKNAAAAQTRVNRKLFFIIQLLLGFYALLCGFENYSYNNYMDPGEYMAYPTIALLPFFAAIGCGFFVCSALFKDMHNVQQADVTLSLPLKASERYMSKLLSLFYIHILPIVAWSAVGALFSCIGCGFKANMIAPALISSLNVFVVGITAALFTDAVSIFCGCCCGTAAESIYFPIITAGCISITPIYFAMNVVEEYAGMYISENMLTKTLGIWSYYGCLMVESIEKLSGAGVYIRFAVNCLISLAVIFACVLIYKKRDARTVGNPIVFKSMFEFMMFLGVFTVFTVMSYSGAIHIGLVISLTIYIIIRIVVSRAKVKFKDVMLWLVKFAGSAAVFLGVMAAGYYTDGFGYVNHVPSDRELENAEIMIEINHSYGYDNGEYDYDIYQYENTAELSSDQIKDIIAAVRNKNTSSENKSIKDFLSTLQDSGGYYTHDWYQSYAEINISRSYHYKNGSEEYWGSENVLDQSIEIPEGSIEQLLAELDKYEGLERQDESRSNSDEYYDDYLYQ